MPFYKTKDNVSIYYKDWDGRPASGGPTIVFSHGWPLSSDNWESQMFFLSSKGCRTVAHDRRGHGRSDQPWEGNNVDTWADDLYGLIEHLDLKDVMLVGHSTGGGEVARVLGRHGESRISRAVFIDSVPPSMAKNDAYPEGLDKSVFDGFRAAQLKDRAQFFLDVPTGPFFGYNRDGAKVSQGMIWSWWQSGMQAGLKATYDTVASWEHDYTDDLKKITIPVLVLHGDDDQVVPYANSAPKTAKLVKNGTLKTYPGGCHALPNIYADQVNKDLWDFLHT